MSQYFFKHESELPDSAGNNLGLSYYITLALMLFLFVALISFYKRLSQRRRRTFLVTLAVIMPLLELARIVWLLQRGQFDIKEDLPLQVCRLMLLLESAASLTGSAKLKTFGYAVGLPGAVLAYIFPPVGGYPVISFEYLRYFTNHFLLALVPLLWVLCDGFRPKIDLRILFGTILCAALIMLGVNSLLGSNYFYVSNLPAHISINISQPWYFLAITAFMMAVSTLMMLPFLFLKTKNQTE